MKTILVLAANPKDTSQLRLDQEIREITYGLQRAQRKDEFDLKQRLAVRPIDVRRAMLDFQPNIVHFCGHGEENDGIAFEDDLGNSKLVQPEALAGLFELFSDKVECVFLNACFSENQAKAIAKHINYVLGMEKEIGDAAAIEFAVAFYDALGAGKSVEFAFQFGRNAVQMTGSSEHLTPHLLTRDLNDTAIDGDKNSNLLRDVFERELDSFDSFYSNNKRTGIVVHIYWHKKGLSYDEAQRIKNELAQDGIAAIIIEHRDPNPPDAVFIGALVSAYEARIVLSKVSYPIHYIFPLDYPREQGGDPNGLLIGIGYMSTHNPIRARRETLPIQVSQYDIERLTEAGISNTEFQNRLRILLEQPYKGR